LALGGPGLALAAEPAAEPQAEAIAPYLIIHKVYTGNEREVSFAVSWNTDELCRGSVTYGQTTPPATVVQDSLATNVYNHFVTIGSLTPGVHYYFQVGCGALVDDNGGAYYTVTTGPILGLPPAPYSAGGIVYQYGGVSRAPYPLVYLRLVDRDGLGTPGVSQWGVVRGGNTGGWGLAIPGLRSQDGSAYFDFTPGEDELQIVWQGGPYGAMGETGNEIYYPAPAGNTTYNMTLDNGPTAVQVVQFSARAGLSGQEGLGVLCLGLALVLTLLGLKRRARVQLH
jgi:hypothetical protein